MYRKYADVVQQHRDRYKTGQLKVGYVLFASSFLLKMARA